MKKINLLIILVFLASAHQVSAVEVIDTDNDKLSDEVELQLATDPNNSDTDGDAYLDGEEVSNGYNPLVGNRDSKVKRTVEVNLDKQRLYYFLNGVIVKEAPVSTGKIGTETPVGDFKIIRKLPVHHYVGRGYNLPNTKWNLEFKRSYYLHGAYWHNQFGIKPMSHGCVNIGYKDAEQVYKFLKVGDSVKVYGKTPRKPLAKAK